MNCLLGWIQERIKRYTTSMCSWFPCRVHNWMVETKEYMPSWQQWYSCITLNLNIKYKVSKMDFLWKTYIKNDYQKHNNGFTNEPTYQNWSSSRDYITTCGTQTRNSGIILTARRFMHKLIRYDTNWKNRKAFNNMYVCFTKSCCDWWMLTPSTSCFQIIKNR